jgi:hypothetical protein
MSRCFPAHHAGGDQHVVLADALGTFNSVTADPLEQLVEQDLTALFEDVESERDVKLLRTGHPRYDKYSDAQIWTADR